MALLETIQQDDNLSKEQKEYLNELINIKKYGLVWETKPEDVQEKLRTHIPFLKEDEGRRILNSQSAPNHLIIEGDNYQALTDLCYIYGGKVDVIYIDPPYNTGNKDFAYNDSFVDREDGFRHSMWLSFMEKRLRLAKRLLSDKGVIFISIDDNEQAQLKLLCDEVFGESNKIGLLPTIMNLKGNQDEFGFAGCHEYTIVYSKSKESCCIGQLDVNEEDLDQWLQDDIGYYKKGATLKRTGADSPREKRPYCYFPILVFKRNNSVKSITAEEYKMIFNSNDKTFNDEYIKALTTKYNELGYQVILPIVNGIKASWRWGFNTVCKYSDEIIVTGEGGSISLYKKQRPEIGDLPSKKAKTILYKPQYSSGNGTAQLKSFQLEGSFNNPKPIDLIMDLCKLGTSKNSTILDFFAGSGTTLHATMQLNKEDGGKRKCILVTNNEKGICENVTYVRNRKVITGYTTPKGHEVEGLKDNNLRYYKVELMARERSFACRNELQQKGVDMLCIKEDIYSEQSTFGKLQAQNDKLRYFAEYDREMLVVLDYEWIGRIVEELKGMKPRGKIKVYVSCPKDYPFTEEFEEVAEKVELIPFPAQFLNIYNKVAPKMREKSLDGHAERELTEDERRETAEDYLPSETTDEGKEETQW